MLTIETLAFLRTADGTDLLDEAARVMAETGSTLQALTWLRKRHPADLVAAAVETVDLRRRAAKKFSRAAEMFFTRDGLEQATGEAVARHTAHRFAGYPSVADLCCGIGGDTIALAGEARVVAVDRDPLRLAIARANCEINGVADRVTFAQAEVGRDPLPAVDAAFCDPGRRDGERRVFDVWRYQPPLSVVLGLRVAVPALSIKVAPGIRDEDVPSNCEVEFIQEGRDLKQATLWLGPLVAAGRRATLLPCGATLLAAHAEVLVTDPGAVLYEPEPAVIRAHAIRTLAEKLGATKLDETTAYLTAAELSRTPFARAFAVEEWQPFNLKALRSRLRDLDVGTVTVKKRASPLDPQELERLLQLRGAHHRVLVLTRVRGRHSVLICHELFESPPVR